MPRDVADTLPLETFKSRLDGALRSLISLKMSLSMLGELDQITLKDSSQCKLFYDSINPVKLFHRQKNR